MMIGRRSLVGSRWPGVMGRTSRVLLQASRLNFGLCFWKKAHVEALLRQPPLYLPFVATSRAVYSSTEGGFRKPQVDHEPPFSLPSRSCFFCRAAAYRLPVPIPQGGTAGQHGTAEVGYATGTDRLHQHASGQDQVYASHGGY